MHFIYALIDPRTDEIRYIGIAKNLRRRFGNHLMTQSDNSEKDSWIQELLNDGFMPSFRVLETVETRDDASRREVYWIRYYAGQGARLTNIQHRNSRAKGMTSGRFSGPGYYCTEEEIDEELNIRAAPFAVHWDGLD